jgi:hypothetical protein
MQESCNFCDLRDPGKADLKHAEEFAIGSIRGKMRISCGKNSRNGEAPADEPAQMRDS